MTRDIYYEGIEWKVDYDWDDDARTNMSMYSVRVYGSNVDLSDHLLESTLDGLFEELEASFK